MTKIIKKIKPRLSMKLLYKYEPEFYKLVAEHKQLNGVRQFLEFVERQMKPLKP